MSILVIGSSGFIGSHVVEALVAGGRRVTALDLEPPRSTQPDVQVITGDVRDAGTLDAALQGVEAVVHLAAVVGMGVDLQDLPRYVSVNDLGTAALLAAMDRAGVGQLVLSSSMVVYGEGAYRCADHGAVVPAARREQELASGSFDPPCPLCGRSLDPVLVAEDAPLDPRSIYAATKVAQEQLTTIWARLTGGRAAMLRYHNVYGPGMPRDTPYAGVASIFRSELSAGRPPKVFEDGGQRRDFVHVRDVAAANVAALQRVEQAETGWVRPYNVASGTVRTVGDLAAELSRAMSGPAPVVTGEYRLGDVRHITADASRLISELDWRPQVDFAHGIAEVVAGD